MKFFNFVFIVVAVVAIVLSPMTTVGQSSKTQLADSISDKSELRITLRYTSDYYFMGRADSAASPYLSPSIGYYHRSGLSIRAGLSYLTTADDGRVDLYTLSGGYDYYGKKMAAGISLSEYIFNDLSYSVQAEMSTYLNACAGYDFSLFMLFADASLGFSDGTDVFLGAEISKPFFLFKNKLRITPAAIINAGSQKYYNEYYTMRSGTTGQGMGKGRMGQSSTTIQTTQIQEYDKFEILDYEADLQVSYKIKNIRLFVSSTWTFPVNPATFVSDTGNYEEELKNGFYWSSGIRVTIE
jgi:hypothetical protein